MNIVFTQGQISTLLLGILVGIFLSALITWIISSKLMSIPANTKKAMRRFIEILKKDMINKQPISVARILCCSRGTIRGC